MTAAWATGIGEVAQVSAGNAREPISWTFRRRSRPNTIVAPQHLSTLCGNLFYGYDYTARMFVYGVVVPVVCGWALISLALTFRSLRDGRSLGW